MYKWAFPCLLLAGCSAPLNKPTIHPNVIIDYSFTTDERKDIDEGMALWEAADPEVYFQKSDGDHRAVITASLALRVPNAVYVIRVKGPLDTDCPFDGYTGSRTERYGICEGHAGVAQVYGDQAIICLDVTYMGSGSPWGTRLAMHELGHALRLGHFPPPSVMTPLFIAAPAPTPQDIAALHQAWGLPYP